MASNLAKCFNKVLKGVCPLPVTTIVRYTFDKLNMYFLNYSDETDKRIARMFKKNKHKYKYPSKINEWMEIQLQKVDSKLPHYLITMSSFTKLMSHEEPRPMVSNIVAEHTRSRSKFVIAHPEDHRCFSSHARIC
jgi:hypothetical protein